MSIPLLWPSDNAAFPELIKNICYQKKKPTQSNSKIHKKATPGN